MKRKYLLFYFLYCVKTFFKKTNPISENRDLKLIQADYCIFFFFLQSYNGVKYNLTYVLRSSSSHSWYLFEFTNSISLSIVRSFIALLSKQMKKYVIKFLPHLTVYTANGSPVRIGTIPTDKGKDEFPCRQKFAIQFKFIGR